VSVIVIHLGDLEVQHCPVLQLNSSTLDQWLDSLEGVEVEELIYPCDEGCFFVRKKIHNKGLQSFECPCCGKFI
jgi:transposase-like protein